MHEQLKQLREALGYNQTEFSNLLGLGRSTLGMMEVGKREILERHIKTVCSIFNVNEDWFRTGAGEMFVETRDSFLSSIANQYNLDEFDQVILESYLALPADQKKVIKDFIQGTASKFNGYDEIAATKRKIDEEVESYRQELEAELKGVEKSSVSQDIEERKEAN